MTTPLQFAPFVSTVDNAFFPALFALKLDHDKLDESARGVVGLYKPELVRTADSNKMLMLGNAFRNQAAPRESVRAEGILKNVNTLGAFEKADRTAMMKTAGRQIWDAINDSSIYSVPSLLSSFIILCHTDQKKHEVSYWFAFPTLQSNPPWKRSGPIENLTADESTALVDEVGTWRLSVDGREHGFFLARKIRGAKPSTEDEDEGDEAAQRLPYRWEIASLRRFEQGFFNNIPEEDRYVAFVDPSTFPEGPGWSLRNLLILIRQRFHLNKVKILCYRDIHARRDQPRSIILPIEAEHLPNVGLAEMPTVVGWEKKDGKLEAQKVTLQANEETNLADASVDLNLKLMKWRLAPDLDLDKIKNTKCLLLGAGTLGGYVARNLLGWGVRKVTFVDYGKVSYSNPVRQPLFEFSDCAGGGKQKAEQAAEMLKRIYPGVDSKGVNMEVPMLGHPFINEAKARGSYDTLKSLIQEHDVIFLLMDTRESRWLPTVMGKAEGKIVMNAALGFDSYVVMRHGAEGKAEKDSPALGCYYCNDVVAPTDSTRDVTLDQQCTVTRPGVAAIASALLVEVLTSLLQHPLLNHAPAPQPTPGHIPERDPPNHPLGLVPHQIRGWVSTFQNMVIRGHAYDCCSACSPKILDAYRTDGWEFVKRALLDKEYVAELSGLAELHRQAEKLDADLDWDEEDNGLAADEGDGELL